MPNLEIKNVWIVQMKGLPPATSTLLISTVSPCPWIKIGFMSKQKSRLLASFTSVQQG